MPSIATRKKPLKQDIYRPLPRKALERGKAIAARYRVAIWREDGEWYGQCVEEPGAMGDGPTITRAVAAVREAVAILVGWHIEDGEPIETPIIDQERRGPRKAG